MPKHTNTLLKADAENNQFDMVQYVESCQLAWLGICCSCTVCKFVLASSRDWKACPISFSSVFQKNILERAWNELAFYCIARLVRGVLPTSQVLGS